MTFHQALAFPLLLDQIALGIWALVLGFRRLRVGSALASALIVDEGLLILQSILGATLFATGHAPQWIHFLYGALLLGLLPVVYPFSMRRPERSGLWLGCTLLFMSGLIVRTYFTGRA
jgi:hypothetical protein